MVSDDDNTNAESSSRVAGVGAGPPVAEPHPLLISALPPTRAHERAALVLVLFLLVLFGGALPFAHDRLPKIDMFVPIIATLMFLTDSMTAVLLFGQFSVLRSRALLVLASGYLFTGLLVVFYALAFPGAFAATGLLGAGLQTTGWIFVLWHVGLPTAVVAYILLNRAPPSIRTARLPTAFAIAVTIAIVVALVCGITWFVIAYNDVLPVLVLDLIQLSGLKSVVLTVVTLCIAAVAMLWMWRRSVLDLWLLVVAFAWLLDSIFMYQTQSRFTVAWYANRMFGIFSACVVLFVLLGESTMLYARLALTVLAQRREREARLMSMDAVAAAIEHEIRQPLGAIVANADAGRRGLDCAPPEIGEAGSALEAIAAHGHRASELIHSVRSTFAQSGEQQTALDTNELIEETVGLVREQLQSMRIAVDLELAPNLPRVSANRGQLQQVILNLVTNAADAMRSVTDRAAVLRLVSKPFDSNGVEVTVADSGTGIDPKIKDQIFDAFFTTKSNGMGMGLAICRSIVEAHGGKLSASAGVPHGAVFQVVLPTADRP